MNVLSLLRVELPDHPGALAAVSRVLAAEGLNVVEVTIHEVDGARAVDEIVVGHAQPLHSHPLAIALAKSGAELLSVAACRPRTDPVVAAATWITQSLERPGRRADLLAAICVLAGITPARIFGVDDAEQIPVASQALRTGRTIVRRVDEVPEALQAIDGGVGSRWLLAAADAPRDASIVVMAARPFATRFTATELTRLAAVLDCNRRLTQSAVVASV